MREFNSLASEDINKIIEIAWENNNPFKKIQKQFGLNEKEVSELMKKEAGLFLFHMWNVRISNKNIL